MTQDALAERHTAAAEYADQLLRQGELASKVASTLTGVAIGLGQGTSRAKIRCVAENASRLLPYYDTLWSKPQQAFNFKWQHWELVEQALSEGRGVILATAHFGPYRWLVPELLRRGLKLTLLVDKPFQRALEQDVKQRVRGEYAEFSDEQFETVSSESSTSLWQMARALRRGRVIVNLIDGNSGIQGKAAEQGSLELDFLGQKIRARPGIAALAATTKAALIPVLAHTEAEHTGLFRVLPALENRTSQSPREYRLQTMTRLFELLESEVLRRPEEWEEWWLLPLWLAGKLQMPCLRSPRGDYRLTRPAMVRARLELPDNSTWVQSDGSRDYLLDLAAGSTSETEASLVSLFKVAETNGLALDWLESEADESAAKEQLQREIRSGRIVLCRPNLPTPPNR